jgi:sarcosine oxidase
MAAYDVAVVGLGAMGSAALYHLAARGQRVIGLERATPGHDGGSSHGESRIIRMAYFEHPSYVPLLRRAYENWRALERATGADLLTITGILQSGIPGATVVAGARRAALEHGLAHEMLSAGEVAARFPAFAIPEHWETLFEADGGFLRPERAIDAHVAAARARGAAVRTHAEVVSVEPRAGGVRLALADGDIIQAGAVIVTAGAWIGELFPELAPHLKLTRQVLAWFEPARPALVTPKRFPVFLLETEEEIVYGFPDLAGSGVKAASHLPGRVLGRADEAAQDGDAAEVQPTAAMLARHIPGAAGSVRQLTTCIYTHAPDEDFIIDRHALHPQIVLASPCSGHGFKFASVIGEILADLATQGSTPHDISRFRLDRLSV